MKKYGSAIAYARKALNISRESAKAYFLEAKVISSAVYVPGFDTGQH